MVLNRSVEFMKRVLLLILLSLAVSSNAAAQQSGDIAALKTAIALDNSAGGLQSVAFNQNSDKILLHTENSFQIRSVETGALLQIFSGAPIAINEINHGEWQPNGALVLLWSSDYGDFLIRQKNPNAFVWDTASNKIAATLSGAAKPIQFAKWSKTGERIVTSNFYFDEISIWTKDGALLNRKIAKGVKSVGFIGDSNNLLVLQAAKDAQSAIEIWSGDDLKTLKTFDAARLPNNKTAAAKNVFASKDGKLLCGAIGFSKGVACWETNGAGAPKFVFADDKIIGDNEFLGFNQKSDSFVVAKSKGGKIEIVNAAINNRRSPTTNFNDLTRGVQLYAPYSAALERAAWSANDEFIVVRTNDRADIFRARNAEWTASVNLIYLTSFTGTPRQTSRLVKKPASKSSGGSGKSGGKKAEYETVYETTYDYTETIVDSESLFLNPTKQILAAVSRDRLKIRSLENGATLQTFPVDSIQNFLPQWNSNGNLLLVAPNNSTLTIWEISPLVK